MLRNRLLGWHPGLFQQPALFVLTSIWLGHGSHGALVVIGRQAEGPTDLWVLEKYTICPKSWIFQVGANMSSADCTDLLSSKVTRTWLPFWRNQHSLAKWQATHLNDAMAASTPAALPVPLVMALPFQSMTAALMKNVCWPLSAKAFPPGQRWSGCGPQPDHLCPGGQQRNVTAPILATVGSREWAMEAAHHVPSSRIFKKQTTLKRFQGSFIRLAVKSSGTFFLSIFFRMSSGERRLNHGWSANSLRSGQLRRRFCPRAWCYRPNA